MGWKESDWDEQTWARLREVEAAARWIKGPPDVLCSDEEFVVLSGVRNGELWLKSFFEHYDKLGAKHYFFFDNGSTDSTLSILSSKTNVTIVQCHLPFDQYYSYFYRFILWRFGRAKWCLYIDQDHHFDYPGSQYVPMNKLLRYLNFHQYNAVRTHIIDMFSKEPLNKWKSAIGDEIKELYPLCDLSDLWAVGDPYKDTNTGPGKDIPYLIGGIRKKVFGTKWIYLTCHSLLYDGVSTLLPDGHSVRGAHVADFAAMIWHYKFLDNFYSIAGDLLKRWTAKIDSPCSWAILREQEAYVNTVKENPELSLAGPQSFKPDSSDDFVRLGILHVSKEYAALVREHLPATESASHALRAQEVVQT